MFYRNPFIRKPNNAIWSDKSEASTILNNEFFGVPSPTTVWGKIKIAGTFVDITNRQFKVGGVFTSALGYKVKVGGVFVDLV